MSFNKTLLTFFISMHLIPSITYSSVGIVDKIIQLEQEYEKICQNSDNLNTKQIQTNLNNMLTEIDTILENSNHSLGFKIFSNSFQILLGTNAVMTSLYSGGCYFVHYLVSTELKREGYTGTLKESEECSNGMRGFIILGRAAATLSALSGMSLILWRQQLQKSENQQLAFKNLKIKITTKLQQIVL